MNRRPARHVVPVVPVAALALVVVAVGGTLLGFNQARAARAVTGSPAPGTGAGAAPVASGPPVRREVGSGQPVLIVSGYGSTWDGRSRHPIPGDYLEQQFSYRGLGQRGTPLAYGAADTVKTVSQLDRMLLAQVASLHARTGQKVDIVAESEGALIAETALLASPRSAVATLVLASPLLGPGRVYYPTSGDSGWGIASDEAMRLISDAFQGVAPVDLSPDNAFLASLDQQAPDLEAVISCPISGVRRFALLPLADATAAPVKETLPFPSVVLPAFHGGLIESASGLRVVAEILAHRPVGDNKLLSVAEDAITYASSAWQVPSLVPSDYPATASPAGGFASCSQVAAKLKSALHARS
jgi:hypothetical protein